MNERYIGVNEFFRQLEEGWHTNDTEKGKTIQAVLERVVTPIVVGIPEMICRCEKCKYVYFNSSSETYHCKRRGHYSEEVKLTDFCSYGKPQ